MTAEGSPVAPRSANRPTPAHYAHIARLLTAAQGGDRDSMAELVAELTPLLWQVARSQGLDRHSSADVVQTTWLHLLASLNRIRDPFALTGWLITATRREAWRMRDASRAELAAEEGSLALLPDPEAPPEEQFMLDERKRVAVVGRRPVAGPLPAVAAHRRVRPPTRLRRGQRGTGHAARQHRPHPRSLPRQAARPAGRGPRTELDMTSPESRAAGEPFDEQDAAILAEVRQLWAERDPLPDGLVDQIQFAIDLECLDVEVLRMTLLDEATSARGDELSRLVTFSSDTLTIMIRVFPGKDGTNRIDGWLTPGDSHRSSYGPVTPP